MPAHNHLIRRHTGKCVELSEAAVQLVLKPRVRRSPNRQVDESDQAYSRMMWLAMETHTRRCIYCVG